MIDTHLIEKLLNFLSPGIKSIEHIPDLMEFDPSIKKYNPKKRINLIVYINNKNEKWTMREQVA